MQYEKLTSLDKLRTFVPAISLSFLLNYSGGADPTLAVLALGCLLLQLGYFLWLTRHSPRKAKIDAGAVLLTALFAWALASSLWSVFPHGSLVYALPLGFMLAGYLAMQATLHASTPAKALTLLAIPVSASALAQMVEFALTARSVEAVSALSAGELAGFANAAALAKALEIEAAIRKAGGWFVDPNAFATFMNAYFFPLLFWHVHARLARARATAWLTGGVLLLLFSAQVLALSMAGLATFVLCIAVTLCLLGVQLKQRIQLLLPVGLALAVCYGLLTLAMPEDAITPAERFGNLSRDNSASTRGLLYQAAWQFYREEPVLGTGFGTFKQLYPRVRNPTEWSTTGNFVHSDPLQMLMEGGPLLLMLFLAPGFYASRLLWHSLRDRDSAAAHVSGDGLLGQGFAVGLACIYLQSLVNFNFYVAPLALSAGLFLAAIQKTLKTEQSVTSAKANPVITQRNVSGAALIGFCVYLGYVVLDGLGWTVLHEDNCDSAWCRRWQPDFATRHKLATALSALQPEALAPRTFLINANLSLYAHFAADEAQRDVWLDNALQEGVELLQQQPDLQQPYFILAELLALYPQLMERLPADPQSDPESLYLRSLALDPLYIPAYLSLYKVYRERGDYARGYELLTERALLWFSPGLMSQQQAEAILLRAMEAAVQTGKSEDARELAKALLNIAPDHTAAREYLRANPDPS